MPARLPRPSLFHHRKCGTTSPESEKPPADQDVPDLQNAQEDGEERGGRGDVQAQWTALAAIARYPVGLPKALPRVNKYRGSGQ